MGSGGHSEPAPVQQAPVVEKEPEYIGTPALARNVSRDSAESQAVQTEARSRLRGIRSTFNRYDSIDGSGTTSRLG